MFVDGRRMIITMIQDEVPTLGVLSGSGGHIEAAVCATSVLLQMTSPFLTLISSWHQQRPWRWHSELLHGIDAYKTGRMVFDDRTTK